MATQHNGHVSAAEQLSDLLLRWHELRAEGREPSPEELCADCPELAAEVRQQIEALQSMEAILDLDRQAGDERRPPAEDTWTTQFPGDDRSEARRAGAGAVSIPGYEILEVLGEGGMGVVYKARQVALNRLVAIKMTLAGPHARPEQLARFRTEAEAVAQLRHPNVVQIYEVGDCAGQPYFSMEYLDGGTLAQKLSTSLLPARQAAQLIATLADAVHAAHQRGIIHRDLKPANILLQKDEGRRMKDEAPQDPDSSFILHPSSFQAKITDFGLAKQLNDVKGQTQTGAIMGTPSYLSPEQAEGKTREIGPATDLYALGAILYEMLTGRPPFQGESTLDILEQVRLQEPVPPGRLQRKVPRDLETICLKCLAKDPKKRYACAADLSEDLRRYLAGQPILARPTPPWERGAKWAQRKPALAALLAVSAAAVLSLLIGWAVFTAQLRDQRDFAKEQERQAQTNLKIAEAERREAQQQRDAAEAQHHRAEVVLVRCLAAVDAQAEATEIGRATKDATGEKGSIFYVLARFYAATAATYRTDAELTPEDRRKLADQYVANAFRHLQKAHTYRYFDKADNLRHLKQDADLDTLRPLPQFKKLLAQVEGEGKGQGP
jgi:serine/threonine protein kinase